MKTVFLVNFLFISQSLNIMAEDDFFEKRGITQANSLADNQTIPNERVTMGYNGLQAQTFPKCLSRSSWEIDIEAALNSSDECIEYYNKMASYFDASNISTMAPILWARIESCFQKLVGSDFRSKNDRVILMSLVDLYNPLRAGFDGSVLESIVVFFERYNIPKARDREKLNQILRYAHKFFLADRDMDGLSHLTRALLSGQIYKINDIIHYSQWLFAPSMDRTNRAYVVEALMGLRFQKFQAVLENANLLFANDKGITLPDGRTIYQRPQLIHELSNKTVAQIYSNAKPPAVFMDIINPADSEPPSLPAANESTSKLDMESIRGFQPIIKPRVLLKKPANQAYQSYIDSYNRMASRFKASNLSVTAPQLWEFIEKPLLCLDSVDFSCRQDRLDLEFLTDLYIPMNAGFDIATLDSIMPSFLNHGLMQDSRLRLIFRNADKFFLADRDMLGLDLLLKAFLMGDLCRAKSIIQFSEGLFSPSMDRVNRAYIVEELMHLPQEKFLAIVENSNQLFLGRSIFIPKLARNIYDRPYLIPLLAQGTVDQIKYIAAHSHRLFRRIQNVDGNPVADYIGYDDTAAIIIGIIEAQDV